MSDRLRDGVERCLSQVPESRYRQRLAEELEAHAADLRDGFLAGGCAPEEAEALALEMLGPPERLGEEFRAAWLRQPERFRRDARRLLMGCFLALLGHLAAMGFLGWFGSAEGEASAVRRALGLWGSPRWRLFADALLFAGEMLPPLAWLLLRFRRDPARRAWVTAGLALTWGLDKALLILRDGGLRGVPLPWLLGTLGAALALGLMTGGG